jgi:heavy metal sensor kinase
MIMFKSVRTKLTALYVMTVSVFLALFVAMDYMGLKENLLTSLGNDPDEAALKNMETTLFRALEEHILLAVILIIPVSFLGYFIIKKALSPVRNMSNLAKKISAEDLSLRINNINESGEIGELADTFNSMIDRLERSFSQIKQFSEDVSHELKTPLTVLKGEIAVCLKKERTCNEYESTLKILNSQVARLTAIIDDLLTLSQIENMKIDMLEVFSLDTLLLEIFEEFTFSAKEKGLDMQLETIDEVSIQGNSGFVRRMISNIVQNSIKYTEKGSILISLKKDPDSFKLSISDTGIGIPLENITNIFDRFYRVDKSRSSDTGGSGLGLSIVKKISEIHGFDIQVKSELNKGTRFEISKTGQF